MAERSRAYVSDPFARIPPWCNGSTRVFEPLVLVRIQEEELGGSTSN